MGLSGVLGLRHLLEMKPLPLDAPAEIPPTGRCRKHLAVCMQSHVFRLRPSLHSFPLFRACQLSVWRFATGNAATFECHDEPRIGESLQK